MHFLLAAAVINFCFGRFVAYSRLNLIFVHQQNS